MPQWFVYLVRCRDGALYTGITTDVSRRFAQHQQNEGKGAKYLRGKGPLRLVFKKAIGRRGLALRVEGRIKRLPKGRKEELIEQDDMIKQMVTQAKKELFRRVGVS
jgi:putative endonuclease